MPLVSSSLKLAASAARTGGYLHTQAIVNRASDRLMCKLGSNLLLGVRYSF